jgi:hypothetical protein
MKKNVVIWVGSRLMFFCFVRNFWLFYLINLMGNIWVNFNIIHDFIIEIFQQIIKFLLAGFVFIMQITDLIVEFVILSILIVFWNQFDNNYFIEKWYFFLWSFSPIFNVLDQLLMTFNTDISFDFFEFIL